MTPQQLASLKSFLEHYQFDENLKPYRQFVNAYTPKEEDIQAIFSGRYEFGKAEILPSVYGSGQMVECQVGQTVFRIWGDAFKYIDQQNTSSVVKGSNSEPV